MEKRVTEWITSSEAASHLGIESQTLALWRMNRFGPPYYKINKRTIYYKADEVKGWLSSFRCDPMTGIGRDDPISIEHEEAIGSTEAFPGVWVDHPLADDEALMLKIMRICESHTGVL